MSEPRALVEHFFRHEFGRLCAVLTRSLGVRRLELVEDVVQAALVQAVGSPCEVSPHGVSRYQARMRFAFHPKARPSDGKPVSRNGPVFGISLG